MSDVSENLQRVREQMAQSAERSGRSADAVTLITVSKTWPAEVVQKVVDVGANVLGENRVQEAEGKVGGVQGDVSWHLIGHLQRNKVKSAVELFDVIHSVDSLRLAREIGKRAVQAGMRARVLVQVNTSGEGSKFGVEPDEAMDVVGQMAEMDGLGIEGVMTIGAFEPDPEAVRPEFVQLRELRDRIAAAYLPGVSMAELSMGMTNDFEVAIEEGATMVRVGAAILGPGRGRDYDRGIAGHHSICVGGDQYVADRGGRGGGNPGVFAVDFFCHQSLQHPIVLGPKSDRSSGVANCTNDAGQPQCCALVVDSGDADRGLFF